MCTIFVNLCKGIFPLFAKQCLVDLLTIEPKFFRIAEYINFTITQIIVFKYRPRLHWNFWEQPVLDKLDFKHGKFNQFLKQVS